MKKRTALIVDDDALFVDSLRFLLEQEGYQVRVASSGEAALQEASRGGLDVVLLDVGLPAMGGYAVCRRLREFTDVPIVMVTGRRQEVDKIVGLDSGADDYVTKPIASGELLARLRAVLRRARRSANPRGTTLLCGPIRLHREAHEVWVRGERVDLTPREFALLEYFLCHAGRVVHRQDLLAHVWGPEFYGEERVLDVYVHALRRKIEPDPDRPTYLQTVRGIGYKLIDPERLSPHAAS